MKKNSKIGLEHKNPGEITDSLNNLSYPFILHLNILENMCPEQALAEYFVKFMDYLDGIKVFDKDLTCDLRFLVNDYLEKFY